MRHTVVERLRDVTGFIRFETGDRVRASACLAEEAADLIEALQAERDSAWNDGLEAAAFLLEKHDGCPMEPNENWSDEVQQYYVSAQIDASISWQRAIRAMKKDATT